MLLPWWTDKQRREWCPIDGSHWHTKFQRAGGIYHTAFVDSLFAGILGVEMESDAISLFHELFLLFSFLSFFPTSFFFLQCHLLHIKLVSIGNNSSCQRGSCCASWAGRGLLSELSKSPHRLVRWLCVCQPTCPALPPPSLRPLPSIHPPSLLLSAQGLIDQPCPGSCPQITQLDVFCVWVKWINYRAKSNGNHGARKSPLNATEEGQRETGRNRGGWGGSGPKTDGREARMRAAWRKQWGM